MPLGLTETTITNLLAVDPRIIYLGQTQSRVITTHAPSQVAIIQNQAVIQITQDLVMIINLLILDIRQVAPPDQITAHHPLAHSDLLVEVRPDLLVEVRREVEKLVNKN
jgi:hypothetical protein